MTTPNLWSADELEISTPSVRPEFVLVGHAEMTSDCLSDSTLLTRLVHFLGSCMLNLYIPRITSNSSDLRRFVMGPSINMLPTQPSRGDLTENC